MFYSTKHFNQLLIPKNNLSMKDKRDFRLKSLIELGINGHFPLFERNWIEESTELKVDPKRMTLEESEKIRNIIERLEKHTRIDRQQTILLSLNHQDRSLFIKAFLTMVETRILDIGPQLH